MEEIQKKKQRNSLIELYRFIFAFNVVKNHGYFPYQGCFFSPGRISVEFFFILSGWFMIKNISKYDDQSFFKGLFNLIKDKIFALGIPLLVGILFNIPYKILVGMEAWWDISIWGYLWYVHDLLIVLIFYFCLKRLVKNKKTFLWIAFAIFVVTSVLHAVPILCNSGYLRAFPIMTLGMFASFLPKLNLKKWQIWTLLSLVYVYILRMLLFDFSFIEEEILDLIMYPSLVYLSLQIDCQNKIFNYLGSLSFGLYAYQSIFRFFKEIGYNNAWISFIAIVVLTVATDFIKRLIKIGKQKDNLSEYINRAN